MSVVAVPTDIYDAIIEMLDRALAEYPDARPDREYLKGVLISYVDKHGKLPESFRLEPKP